MCGQCLWHDKLLEVPAQPLFTLIAYIYKSMFVFALLMYYHSATPDCVPALSQSANRCRTLSVVSHLVLCFVEVYTNSHLSPEVYIRLHHTAMQESAAGLSQAIHHPWHVTALEGHALTFPGQGVPHLTVGACTGASSWPSVLNGICLHVSVLQSICKRRRCVLPPFCTFLHIHKYEAGIYHHRCMR